MFPTLILSRRDPNAKRLLAEVGLMMSLFEPGVKMKNLTIHYPTGSISYIEEGGRVSRIIKRIPNEFAEEAMRLCGIDFEEEATYMATHMAKDMIDASRTSD